MGKYTTISVPAEVKRQLKMLKKDKTWGCFLLESATEWQRIKGERAFKELRALLSDEDLEAIRKSSREFRKNFVLRDMPSE